MRSAMLWAASIANDCSPANSWQLRIIHGKYNLIYKNMENILT